MKRALTSLCFAFPALLLGLGGADLSLAKGLQQLSPAGPGQPEQKAVPAAEEKEEAKTLAPAPPKEAPSSKPKTPAAAEPGTSGAPLVKGQLLKNSLHLGASFAKAHVKKDGQSLFSGGGADVLVAYPLLQLGRSQLLASLRYLAVDVSPHFKSDGETEAYQGIMESYLLGALIQTSLGSSLRAVGHVEVGLAMLHLTDQLFLTDITSLTTRGSQVTLGGGLEWVHSPNFSLGPKVQFGFGAFQTLQAGVSATFAF